MTADPGPVGFPPDALPPAAKLTERPHPLTPFIRGWVVLLAVVISMGREFLPNGEGPRPLPPLEIIVAVVAALAAAAGVAGYISWRFTRFVIDADELRVDTGAIFRRSIRIAFDKVQSIDVVQPLAARMFGLAELQIDIGSHERSKLRYLQLGRAYALRDYLLARARGYQAEAATTTRSVSVLTDLHEADEVLVQVLPQTLLLAAVTSHEFWAIVLGGLLFVTVGLAIGQFTLRGLMWCGGLSIFLFYLPDILIYNKGVKYQDELRRGLADALDMLTVCVEAGQGFDAALLQVARAASGPITGEFARVLSEIQIGKSRGDAFTGLADRTTVPEAKNFVSALVQADRLGLPVASVLREQSNQMRLVRRQLAEEKAQKVPVKILFPVMLGILPALFVVVIGPGGIRIAEAFATTGH